MAAGIPLTDEDRWPWLQGIAAWIDVQIAAGQPAVVSCSALHRVYRDVFRRPEVQIVYLHGNPDLIAARLTSRQGHFFKREMLDSQFAALEEPGPDEHVITVSIEGTPVQVVDRVLAELSK
jgi:gluconokinase